ncbi:MAG UNVERIFIED_CONTAM: hypothetical protein LVR18_06705 [Planctomycetaceae bacterium]
MAAETTPRNPPSPTAPLSRTKPNASTKLCNNRPPITTAPNELQALHQPVSNRKHQ